MSRGWGKEGGGGAETCPGKPGRVGGARGSAAWVATVSAGRGLAHTNRLVGRREEGGEAGKGVGRGEKGSGWGQGVVESSQARALERLSNGPGGTKAWNATGALSPEPAGQPIRAFAGDLCPLPRVASTLLSTCAHGVLAQHRLERARSASEVYACPAGPSNPSFVLFVKKRLQACIRVRTRSLRALRPQGPETTTSATARSPGSSRLKSGSSKSSHVLPAGIRSEKTVGTGLRTCAKADSGMAGRCAARESRAQAQACLTRRRESNERGEGPTA